MLAAGWSVLTSIIPNAIGLIGDHFKGKRELKAAALTAKVKALETAQLGDIDWEKLMAEGSKESWKDEFWTVIFGYLLISPVFDDGVTATKVFAAFSTAPEWFQLCVLVSVGASFGVKIWKGFGK